MINSFLQPPFFPVVIILVNSHRENVPYEKRRLLEFLDPELEKYSVKLMVQIVTYGTVEDFYLYLVDIMIEVTLLYLLLP